MAADALPAMNAAAQPLPAVSIGRLERLPALASRHIAPRPIEVWLPPGYDGQRPHGVLYMHDGQALFDGARSLSGAGWRVDEALARLIARGAVPDTIVVGLWNTGTLRHGDYYPDKMLPLLPGPLRERFVREALAGSARADAYLRHLVEEVKPAIDARYAVRAGRDDTAVIGSSMGGLVSLYAFCEYPQVFGAAGCLSTHWIGHFQDNADFPLAALNYLHRHLPPPQGRRLYMDRGTAGMEATYAAGQALADRLVRDKGYDTASYRSLVFDGADHTERDWAARLEVPLGFVLGAGH